MHDIRLIRDEPHTFDAGLARRGLPPASAEILALDERRRACISAAEQALADRNAASREVGAAKARGDEAEFARLRALVADKKDEIARARGGSRRGGRRAPRPSPRHAQPADGRRARRAGRNRQRRDPPLGRAAELRPQAAGTLRDPGRQARLRLRGRRPALRQPLRGSDGRAGATPPGAGAVHARRPRRSSRPDRGLDPRTRARRGDDRDRPAAQVRRGQLSDHQRLVAYPDLRGHAHQPRRRPDPRRGANCRCA